MKLILRYLFYGTVTMQVAVLTVPSGVITVTVITALPALMALTLPLVLTVATLVSLEAHVIFLLLNVTGSVVTVSFSLLPTWMLVSCLFKVTLFTAVTTVMLLLAYFLLPSLAVAVIVALPAVRAVTSPFSSTVATLSLLEAQFSPALVALYGAMAVMVAFSSQVFC